MSDTWNQNEDRMKNERTDGQPEAAPGGAYTVTREGDGMKYTPQCGVNSAGRGHGHRGKKSVRVALALLLCLTLCMGAGVGGALLAGRYYLFMGGISNPDDPTRHLSTDGNNTGKNNANATQTQGTPTGTELPKISKTDPLGAVTYSGSAGENAYATLTEAISHAAPSVVEISTETMVSGGWLGNYVSSGAGSGVIISDEGYIVTNNHVIDGADSITVRLASGTVCEAVLVGTDERSDIAVIHITTDEPLTAATLGCSGDLLVGETVFAIGNPLGSLGGTVTDGIISATARNITINKSEMTLLQTNAAVNPGNSGGGLFNMAGQLIGVVNAKCSQDDVEGLGFAIPIDTAYDVICQLIEYGYVRGVVDTGLDLYDVTSSNVLVARRYFGSTQTGVYILSSEYSDEILYGDRLVSIDGTEVTTGAQAEKLLGSYHVGDTVALTLWRQNKRVEVSLTLREYVPTGAQMKN